MKELCKNQFYWPNISEDVDDLYKNCQQSLQCHTSMQKVALGEGVSIDFMQQNPQDVLVIKDKMSGYVAAMLCKNQTSQSNGGPKRTECSLKQVLKKREIRRTDEMRLQ